MKNKSESILKGIVNYSISTWVNLIVGFLYIIISTRILNPSDYGYIVLFTSVSSLLMSLVSFGLDGAYIRFFNSPPEGNTGTQLIYKNMVLTGIICVISGLVCTFSLGSKISLFLFNTDDTWLLGLAFLNTLSMLLLRFLNISFRMGFKAKAYNMQNIIMNSFVRFFILGAALVYNNYIFIITVFTLGGILILLSYLYIQRDEIIPRNINNQVDFSLNFRNYNGYFRFALFSAPSYIIYFLNNFMSQQIVNMKMDSFAMGIFASTGLFSSILIAFQGGFSTYWSAYIYKNYKDEKEKISFIHDYVVIFSTIIVVGLVVLRDVIYKFIGLSYHDSKYFYSLLLVMPILNFVRETTEKGIAIANRNEISMIIDILAVCFNLGLSFFLIDIWGLKGAAFANAFSAIVLYSLSTIFGQKFYCTIKKYSKSCIGVTFILLILSIPSIIYNIWYLIIIVVFIYTMSVYVYKDEYKQACYIIKDKMKNRVSQ